MVSTALTAANLARRIHSNAIVSVAVPVAVGLAVGYLSNTTIKTWYKDLKKPKFNPPNWIFPPMWTTLYAMMGYSSHLVYRSLAVHPVAVPLALGAYWVQFALNLAWSPIFFRLNNIPLASIEIGGVVAAVAFTTRQFFKVDTNAGLMMLPYLGWVSFASYLTWSIWYLNPDNGDKMKKAKRFD
eukprot:TRINITY_DN19597_c0_g1_i1.p1 TRINITY_DN19597_c0_g1~~TRINITY_DN19597_c0_g1_i1.p1  ORF type:complete len:184 (+),score=36.91 TRINITY_DN19597_c0_g1_i1:82-633(+)